MRISHSSYSEYIKSLAKKISGAALYSPVLLNNETFLFPLMNDTKQALVVSLNNKCPLVYLTTSDLFFSSFENSFIKEYRKYYGQVIISDIELEDNDYIISFNLESIEMGNKCNVFVELFPNQPNLILCENNIVKSTYFKYKNRPQKFNEIYITPLSNNFNPGEQLLTASFLSDHFANELAMRNKEKYSDFTKFINNKIKATKRKIDAINEDVKKADEMLSLGKIADTIFTLGLDLKSHYEFVEIDGKKISLDISKTLLENCEHFYKKARKAKETIFKSENNIKNSLNELQQFESILQEFNSRDEKGKDELLLLYKPNKKHEVKATSMNMPWKYNLNGTYIYFGRNASQNDYLSFVMKNDREYTWLHIKDKSGAHLIIANKKPTENELLFACEFALICSHCKTGEIVYTKKKNVRKGHVLGEAILKNYSTIKINNVREETIKAFENIKRCN